VELARISWQLSSKWAASFPVLDRKQEEFATMLGKQSLAILIELRER
jgi:hypothetical protein